MISGHLEASSRHVLDSHPSPSSTLRERPRAYNTRSATGTESLEETTFSQSKASEYENHSPTGYHFSPPGCAWKEKAAPGLDSGRRIRGQRCQLLSYRISPQCPRTKAWARMLRILVGRAWSPRILSCWLSQSTAHVRAGLVASVVDMKPS
jgi:hypothetical protein